MSYSKFRNNSNLDNLKNKFDKLNGKTNFSELDETYWTVKHVGGTEGVGEAIVRFLPAPPDGQGDQEPDDIVKFFQFSTRKNGKYYINKGRNSLGVNEPDPAHEYNQGIWARTDITKDEKKKILIDRAVYYIANVYIVKDPNKPENEGKVMRWQFGSQIYNLIDKQLFPEFETDPSVNVFDPIDGADFIFRVTQKSIPDRYTGEIRRVPSYENSKFAGPSQRWTLEEFDKIWERAHSLQSEVAPDKFRPYDELKQQFDRVMGFNNNTNNNDVKQQTVSTKTAETKQERSLSEELNDEVPWMTGDENNNEPADELFSDNEDDSSGNEQSSEIDDWFKNLGN